MKVKDWRKEMVPEKQPTLADLKPGEVFEIPAWADLAAHRDSVFILTDNGGEPGNCFIDQCGAEYGAGSDLIVRRLKATLVLEDLGKASD